MPASSLVRRVKLGHVPFKQIAANSFRAKGLRRPECDGFASTSDKRSSAYVFA
jgi:hypothetical protein